MFQHRPRAVTLAPPVKVTVAVPSAVVAVIVATGRVTMLSVGTPVVTASLIQRRDVAVALLKEADALVVPDKDR